MIVGTESERAQQVIRELYRPLYLLETPIIFTTRETAEIIKYAANAFLATKITFINEIADLCERIGADVHDVSRGIGLDGRIGRKFLHAGPGFGGSCFPKDARVLVHIARESGTPMQIVEAVVGVNEARKKKMAQRIAHVCGGVKGKTVAILGLTFKPNTDDMRDAPSLAILPELQAQGATIKAFDPEGMVEAKKQFSGIDWCDNAYDALDGADAVAILTEWNEFRALDLSRLKALMRRPLMIDLRNIYNPHELARAGIEYHSIGRPHVPPME